MINDRKKSSLKPQCNEEYHIASSKRLLSFRFKKERWELVLKLEWKKGYQYDIEKFTFKTYSRQV